MIDDVVPVTVVTGYLGAGKTTLVNEWLRAQARDAFAVIVNEFGSIGIDGELLGDRARTIVELSGGCICCVTHAEFAHALGDLASGEPKPRRIVVETSGVASPASLLRVVTHGPHRDRVRLDGVITVVDARKVATLARSDLAMEQVGFADVLCLTRTDALSEEQLEAARTQLARTNEAATIAFVEHGIIRAPAEIALENLIDSRQPFAREATTDRDPPRSEHEAGIESVSLRVDGVLDEDAFSAWMEHSVAPIAGRLLRVKGIVAMKGVDVRVTIQGVGDEVEVTLGEPWRDEKPSSRLVLIGFGLDRKRLADGFTGCAVVDRDGAND